MEMEVVNNNDPLPRSFLEVLILKESWRLQAV